MLNRNNQDTVRTAGTKTRLYEAPQGAGVGRIEQI